MELAESLSFVWKIEETGTEKPPTKKQVPDSITEGLRQVELHQ